VTRRERLGERWPGGLATIKSRLQGGSNGFLGATDGQRRLGKVWVVNDSKANSTT
jgi:hypothetical protein